MKWDDVNARARGLGGRLLGRWRLERLAGAETLADLGEALEGYRIEGGGRNASPQTLERGVRRRGQGFLSLLARWCGERVSALAVLFEDEDRRSLRALLRGAVSGAPPERRLSGLVPTPTLPARALEELARLRSPAQIAGTLIAWGNPYGEAIRPEADSPRPDPFRLELAVSRSFAVRARKGARRGGSALRGFAEQKIDVENALAAVVLSRNAAEIEPGDCYLEGGRRLDHDTFVSAARSKEARSVLAPVFTGTALAPAFREPPAELELALFGRQLEELVSRARLEPLSVFPLLAFVHRLRAEALDLRSLIWSRALGSRALVPLVSL